MADGCLAQWWCVVLSEVVEWWSEWRVELETGVVSLVQPLEAPPLAVSLSTDMRPEDELTHTHTHTCSLGLCL